MAKKSPLSKYDEDFHPKEIIRLMRDHGWTAFEVVREWNIHIDTLHEWKNKHPVFSESYARAKQYRRAWWFENGRKGLFTAGDVRFDSRLFALMMKYDGVNLDERIIKLPALANCKTFSEQATVILGALASGKITVKEAQTYVDTIASCAKIDEVTELRQKLEAIEAKLGNGI